MSSDLERFANADAGLAQSWDDLHDQPRFRPSYPSESVVRFVARTLGRGGTDRPPKRVLDLGCGAGRHSFLAASWGHAVVATDLSFTGLARVLTEAEDTAQDIHGARARMQALPFRSEAFDAVICFGVLLYTDALGMHATVGEVHRILRPGGSALFVTRRDTDGRFGLGTQVEPGTFVIEDDTTNERGMPMRFLSRPGVDELFGQFESTVVDWIDHTSDGGRFVNSDWVVEARRGS